MNKNKKFDRNASKIALTRFAVERFGLAQATTKLEVLFLGLAAWDLVPLANAG